MIRDLNRYRLLKIIQRLKAKIFQDLDADTKTQIKNELNKLDEMYTNNQINIDEYKIKSISLLTKYWDSCRVEQFLYWHTGKFLTPAEKFTLTELSQKVQD